MTIAQNGRARRGGRDRTWPLALRLRVAEAVADSAHGEEVLRLLGVELELLAQVADVDVDRPRVAVCAVAPDAGEEHVARPDAAGVRRERREDLELHVRRRDLGAAYAHAPLGEVDAQLVDVQRLLVGDRVAPRHPAAPERRLDAAAELAQRERLGDVVIGAELEPEDLVDLLGLRREHDDRHGAARPEAPADLEAVEPRHHHVEHDEVERRLAEARERLLPVRRLDDLVAVLAQGVAEERLDRLLVVDEQDAGCAVEHGPSRSKGTRSYSARFDARRAHLPGGAGARPAGRDRLRLLARGPAPGDWHDARPGRLLRAARDP